MTPGDISAILRELATQRQEFREHAEAEDRAKAALRGDIQELKRDVREVKADGKETKAEVKRTNGRVGKLETAKQVQEAVEKRAQQEADQREKDQDREQEQESSRKTAGWGAMVATGGMAGVYVVLEIVHHVWH